MIKNYMNAIILKGFGGADLMKIETIKTPTPNKNQVLIKIYSTSINPLDILRREGRLSFFTGKKFPIILGNDVSGEVVSLGSDVKKFSLGDKVYGMIDVNNTLSKTGFSKSGSYAEYCVTREDTIALIPSNLDVIEAGVIPLAGLTAYQGLVNEAKVVKGQNILINGASGGVGIMAVQLALKFGLNVTTVSSKKNMNILSKLGVCRTLDYNCDDFTNIDTKYDIIYDVKSNSSYKKCKHILTITGIYLSNVATISTVLGRRFLPIKKLFGYQKRNSHVWVLPSADDLEVLGELVKPIIDKKILIKDIGFAHKYFQNNSVMGKVLLLSIYHK
ncbi:MAG: NAD(P)-dependent alcohol dehydrogenase [Spirochaetaceae bacterium]